MSDFLKDILQLCRGWTWILLEHGLFFSLHQRMGEEEPMFQQNPSAKWSWVRLLGGDGLFRELSRAVGEGKGRTAGGEGDGVGGWLLWARHGGDWEVCV